ncbi:MAG: hypothetical protein IPO28_03350 [Holophagaceae bacterium]|nr:hypothetical protein [Holophagaceae bacterium]
MDTLDFSYRLTVSLVGAIARACAKGVPAGWRVRLQAEAPEQAAPGWIWLHAVSVGELLLADGLIGRLRATGQRVHVSTGTPAGLDLLARRLPAWDAGTGRVSGGAFPLDDPAGLEPFLRQAPGAFIALETELWPGLIEALAIRGIPRLVVNGRLTEKSLQRGGPWLRRAAGRLTLVAARDPESAEAFRRLGAPVVALGGNLKADLPPPRPLPDHWAALRSAWAGDPVLVAGNTLEGEEELILGVWSTVRTEVPGLPHPGAPAAPALRRCGRRAGGAGAAPPPRLPLVARRGRLARDRGPPPRHAGRSRLGLRRGDPRAGGWGLGPSRGAQSTRAGAGGRSDPDRSRLRQLCGPGAAPAGGGPPPGGRGGGPRARGAGAAGGFTPSPTAGAAPPGVAQGGA